MTTEAPALSRGTSNANPALGSCRLTSPNLQVRFVDPLRDPDWDRLVCSRPDFNFFHSAAWGKVLRETYGHKPLYLQFSQGGEPVALVPLMEVVSSFTGRRGVCLPFSDYCGPLMFGESGSEAVMTQLSQLARERSWKYFEVRSARTIPLSAPPAVRFYGHQLDLRSGAEALYNRFVSSTRTSIRKAQRSELTAQVTQTRDAILEFYWLHVRTRRRRGLPPQPLSFFLNIHENIIKPGLGFVVIAHRESSPAAAAVFFLSGKKAIYKFAASDERHQEFRGNNLVMWEGIRFLARNNAETLHFGRTSIEDKGLRRFKLSWGTEEETITYFRFDTGAGRWISARESAPGFHKKVFAKLPLALNRLVGTMLYPHLD